MWANAKRDDRPAEYRWRPLFNAAKVGWRPLLECRADTRFPVLLRKWDLAVLGIDGFEPRFWTEGLIFTRGPSTGPDRTTFDAPNGPSH